MRPTLKLKCFPFLEFFGYLYLRPNVQAFLNLRLNYFPTTLHSWIVAPITWNEIWWPQRTERQIWRGCLPDVEKWQFHRTATLQVLLYAIIMQDRHKIFLKSFLNFVAICCNALVLILETFRRWWYVWWDTSFLGDKLRNTS